MKQTVTKNAIRRDILLISAVFTILIGIFVTALSYFLYERYMENSITEAAQTNMKFLAAYIDNELDNVDEVITYCRSSSTIDIYISATKNMKQKKNAAFETLNEYCTNSPSDYLHRVVITNLSNSYIQVVTPAFSSAMNIAETLEEQPFYTTLTRSDYNDYTIGFYQDPFYPRKDCQIIPLLHPLSYKFNSNLGGYIFIEVDQKLFLDAFANSFVKDTGDYLLTLGDKIYKYDGSSFVLLDGLPDQSQYYIISHSLKKKDCAVSLAIPLNKAHEAQNIFIHILILMFVLLVILAGILIVVLNMVITKPVNKIRNRLVQISDGDFSRDTSIEWNHELGDIGRGVNELALSLSSMIDRRIADEKQKKDLEYKMLQSQINPHFIYNTLNSIKWMATIQGASGISDMTTALARLLKSISKGTKLLIPISEELALLDDYFTIQKYRYGGTIELIKEIENNQLLDYQIIKFTLQPLVENAIFHGIEPTGRSGIITISIKEIDSNLQISITDNGIGMSKEKAEAILSGADDNTSEFFKEIGIFNVHKRICYEFGDEYGIRIESKENEFTSMIITIPKQIETTATKTGETNV